MLFFVYFQILAFTQTTIPPNYSNMLPAGGYQPPPNIGFPPQPPPGGYQSFPTVGGYQPPMGGSQVKT